MASIIKADTLQSTTSNVFVLNSAGTEYARFNSSGVFQLANPTTFPAGTAALPSITATGDTNTGIFFPAADTIAFAEGGVESVRIDSSGNVKMTAANTKILNSSGNPILQQTGSVLQVSQSGPFNGISTTSGSTQFSSTNPSITPSSSSNKILLLWSTSVIIDVDNDSQGSNNGAVRFEFQIGGTGGAWSSLGQFDVPGRGGNGTFTNAVFLQSPATTSTVYYRMGVSKSEGARQILINDSWGSNRLFMLEIAG